MREGKMTRCKGFVSLRLLIILILIVIVTLFF